MQALAYVPEFYQGELFYSAMARYHRHVGNICSRDSSGDLFGHRFMRPTFDLPSHLPAFASRVPASRGLTVERLALEHTHLPYYTAYLPARRRKEALQRMVAGEQSLHIPLGLNAFLVPAISRLRFCRTCCEQMEAEKGERWWRRAHQLPGVLVCPDHGCSLSLSTVNLWTRDHHGFAAATPLTCPSDAPWLVEGQSDLVMERLRRIAKESAALLSCRGKFRTMAEMTARYRERLWETGFISSSRIDVDSLLNSFSAYWGETLELLPRVGDAGDQRSLGWLPMLCRKRDRGSHPLLHILFQLFVDSQNRAMRRKGTFGDGPWTCPNPEAGHGDEPTILNVTLKHNNPKMLTGTFECPCGYAYTMSISDLGTLHGPRFKKFGPLLEPGLRRLIDEGKTLYRIARELGLQCNTVAVEAGRLGLAVPWACAPPVHSPRSMPIRRRPAGRSRTKRRWVERRRGPIVDWSARDRAWAPRIDSIADDILGMRPLVRVYLRSIEAHLERLSCISVRKAKLPLTVAAIAARAESIEDFQRRRIHWAIDDLRGQGRRVTVASVRYLAAVPKVWRPYIEEQVALPYLEREAT